MSDLLGAANYLLVLEVWKLTDGSEFNLDTEEETATPIVLL